MKQLLMCVCAPMLLALSGCASNPSAPDSSESPAASTRDWVIQNKVDHAVLNPGSTTRDDVIAYLGWPQRQSTDQLVLVYLWNEKPNETGPLFARYLFLEFDARGILQNQVRKDSREATSPFSDPLFDRHPGPLVQP
jgi:hypothetical protein